jgi:hypothetical protein
MISVIIYADLVIKVLEVVKDGDMMLLNLALVVNSKMP